MGLLAWHSLCKLVRVSMRLVLRAAALLTLATSLALAAACSLNPQPLPPNDGFTGSPDASTAMDAGAGADGATFNDAAPPMDDAATDARSGDGGDADAGDASDASDAANLDGGADAPLDGVTE